MSDQLRTLGLRLYDIGCFQDKKQSPGGKGFKLKLHERNPDAPLSPFYLNLRTPDNPKPGPLHRELVDEIGALLYGITIVEGHDFDCVLGVPRAGDPLAAAVSIASGKPLLRLNKEEGTGGRRVGSVLEGDWKRRDLVLLIDDLITRADSKLEAIEALGHAGLWVNDVMVVVDREQGGTGELNARGYSLYALFTISELLGVFVEGQRMTPAERDEILAYIRVNATT